MIFTSVDFKSQEKGVFDSRSNTVPHSILIRSSRKKGAQQQQQGSTGLDVRRDNEVRMQYEGRTLESFLSLSSVVSVPMGKCRAQLSSLAGAVIAVLFAAGRLCCFNCESESLLRSKQASHLVNSGKLSGVPFCLPLRTA